MPGLFGGGSWISTVIWFLMFFVFIFLYPKLMIKQMVMKIEKETREIEKWSDEARDTVAFSMKNPPTKKLKKKVTNFLEFFLVQPVKLDPRGVIGKLDRVIKDQRNMFRRFVKENSNKENEEEKASLEGGLAGAIATHQIAKIVRHYLELIKKYNNLQLAMVLQMQIPMIKKVARAAVRGTENMCKSEPVGDAIGPYVIAKLIGDSKVKEMEDFETVYTEKEIGNRKCVLVKAKGPGSRTGFPGKTLEKLIDKYNPKRIITIDASGKLEGEKTGSIAEGVGVAMGGFGVERYQIEEKATKKDIPVDAIAVKMRPEEAIYAMKKPVWKSVDEVTQRIENALLRVEEGENVIILGVGNSCGIGNQEESLEEADKKIKKNIKKLKKEKKKRKEERSILDKLSPF